MDAEPMGSAYRRFPTTSWTLILDATGQSAESSAALAKLCSAYWPPVYSFIRYRGHPAEDARDLTQEFFARLLENGYLRDYQKERGRFRSFLLGAIRHFLANEWDRSAAQKRGGGKLVISLEGRSAEEHLRPELADHLTPEDIFDRQWAFAVLESVMARVRKEYALKGQSRLFEQLKPFLGGGDRRGDYQKLGIETEASEGALRVAVHRLRRRYAELLRAEIAQTVDNPADIEGEIQYLLNALSGP